MVAAPHRRSGIGTALMAAAEEWARDGAASRSSSSTSSRTTSRAIALYEKLGYEREGLRRGHYAAPTAATRT